MSCSFLSSGIHDKHLNIEHLTPRWSIVGRENVLDDQQSAGGAHGCATVLQNFRYAVVAHPVQDPAHEINICACWNEGNGIPGDYLTAAQQSAFFDEPTRLVRDMRYFQEHAPRGRRVFENSEASLDLLRYRQSYREPIGKPCR